MYMEGLGRVKLKPCNDAKVFYAKKNFWTHWRNKKERLQSYGYQAIKINNKWYVLYVPTGDQTTLKDFVSKSENDRA